MEEKKDKKETKIQLKDVKENDPIEKEIEGIMNVIKDEKIKNGIIPPSNPISINNFAGKVLKRNKSIIFKGQQLFLNKGVAWKDVNAFFRKNMKFSSEDFE